MYMNHILVIGTYLKHVLSSYWTSVQSTIESIKLSLERKVRMTK
jgi:hypothetical protein